MRAFLSYLTTPFFWLSFVALLVIFHPIQWFSHRVFGYEAQKKSVDILNRLLMLLPYMVGSRIEVIHKTSIPPDHPYIVISNHQGTYDIPPLIWHLRHLHAKFISKKELGKGIPSISYNLRHGGSFLIDRQDRKQSMQAIVLAGEYIEKHKRTMVIFPEGSRSRGDKSREWKKIGLKLLMKSAPNASVIPVTMDGTWQFFKHGGFPIPWGNRVQVTIHEPISIAGHDIDELIEEVKHIIESAKISNRS